MSVETAPLFFTGSIPNDSPTDAEVSIQVLPEPNIDVIRESIVRVSFPNPARNREQGKAYIFVNDVLTTGTKLTYADVQIPGDEDRFIVEVVFAHDENTEAELETLRNKPPEDHVEVEWYRPTI